jgi:hypothetical protein
LASIRLNGAGRAVGALNRANRGRIGSCRARSRVAGTVDVDESTDRCSNTGDTTGLRGEVARVARSANTVQRRAVVV